MLKCSGRLIHRKDFLNKFTVHSAEGDDHWVDHPCSEESLLGKLVKGTSFRILLLG